MIRKCHLKSCRKEVSTQFTYISLHGGRGCILYFHLSCFAVYWNEHHPHKMNNFQRRVIG